MSLFDRPQWRQVNQGCKIMAIEQALITKLEPHAKRIRDGSGNDFDYLPAVLLHILEEQKRQGKLLDDTARLLDAVQLSVTTIGEKNKAQIAAFEHGAQKKLDQIETVIKDAQRQLESSTNYFSEQISVLAAAYVRHTTQIIDGQRASEQQIELLGTTTQHSHVNFTRLMIAGLVAASIVIGLVLVVLQRH